MQCAADGESGVIRFFTAANGSGTLQAQTAFNNGECLANPSQYGAASVRFFCNSRSASQDIRQGLTHARLNWYQQSDCEYLVQRMQSRAMPHCNVCCAAGYTSQSLAHPAPGLIPACRTLSTTACRRCKQLQ